MADDEHNVEVHLLEGNDAVNLMLDIYINGFLSGAVSACMTFSGMPEATADKYCRMMVRTLRGDPLAIEECRQQIAWIMAGFEGPEYDANFTLPADRDSPNGQPPQQG